MRKRPLLDLAGRGLHYRPGLQSWTQGTCSNVVGEEVTPKWEWAGAAVESLTGLDSSTCLVNPMVSPWYRCDRVFRATNEHQGLPVVLESRKAKSLTYLAVP